MKILIASPIDADAIESLRAQHDLIYVPDADGETLRARLSDREALIFRSGVQISAEVMACAPELKLLIRAGSGLDNIDMDYVERCNLQLVRIPEPGARAVAELTFAHMLALARNLRVADQLLRQGHWAKHTLTGYLLQGKTLGIVGAGSIGTVVGQMGIAWGMHAIGCVEHPSRERALLLQGQEIELTSFDQVIANADFLTIHVPLKDSTRHLIDASVLARMKQGAFLINMARGGVVDEMALYDALSKGNRLAGAALDVHRNEGEGKISPLAELPNVMLSPHMGAMTVDSQRQIGRRVLQLIESYAVEMSSTVKLLEREL
jgi:D-3-phosphoglycerate dehydrogenase / 2-oxoglutarate reductase